MENRKQTKFSILFKRNKKIYAEKNRFCEIGIFFPFILTEYSVIENWMWKIKKYIKIWINLFQYCFQFAYKTKKFVKGGEEFAKPI